jgi:hypothetical protein
MKKNIFLLSAFLCLCVFVVQSQTITDTRTIGSWVFSLGNGKLDHFSAVNKFPPATIKGKISNENWGDKIVKLSPAVQAKMQAILQVFKDAYPLPYKESVCYGVQYIPAIVGDRPLAYNIHMGDYGFTYDNAGKVKLINPGSQLGDMYEGYGNVYVNYIPEAARTTISSEQGLKIMYKLSYYSNTQQTNTKERPNGKVYAIGPQNNFIKELKNLDTDIENYKLSKPKAAAIKFGNESDNYFAIRRLRASVVKAEQTVSYVMSNFVVVSRNNQLPLIPVSRKEFLNLLEDNLNEEAQVEKDRFEKYVKPTADYAKNKERIDKNNDDNFKDRKRKYDVINLIREVYKNELDKPAIISPDQVGLTDVGFYHIFNVKNVPTAKEINDVFLNDKNVGHALYRVDANFYKDLKEGDIKTIAFEWEEKLLNLPIADNFLDANYIDKVSGKLLTEVKFHRAIQYKFNWSKLASLLNK